MHAADRRERAVAIDQPLPGVRLQLPFREHDRRADDRRRDVHALRILRARDASFEIDREHRVRIGLLRQRNEIGVAVLHRHDRRAVHRRRPQLACPSGSVSRKCALPRFFTK